MPGIWSRLFKTFRRPWKIKHRDGGGFWIEAADGRVLLYVYPKQNNNPVFAKPDEEEALDIVRDRQAVTAAAKALAPSMGAVGKASTPDQICPPFDEVTVKVQGFGW